MIEILKDYQFGERDGKMTVVFTAGETTLGKLMRESRSPAIYTMAMFDCEAEFIMLLKHQIDKDTPDGRK